MSAVRRRVALATVLFVATVSTAGSARAATSALTIDRGVIQTVSPTQIVLRELDGSSLALAVGPRTRVLLNALPAQLADLQPGFVAAVAHNGPRPARVVRAWGRVAPVVDRGVVVSVSPGQLVIRRVAGDLLTVRLIVATRVRLNGEPATVADIRDGMLARVTHTRAGVARLVQLVGTRA
jgi:hypothetical protein